MDQVGFEEQVVVDVDIALDDDDEDDEIEKVAEVPAPERKRRNARRLRDDNEYVVESVLDRS